MADTRAVIGTMLATWEKEQGWRREFADTMALETNRLYQQGFADGLGHAIHTLKVALDVADRDERPQLLTGNHPRQDGATFPLHD